MSPDLIAASSSFSPTIAGRLRAKAFKTKLLDSNEATDTVPKYSLLVATNFVQMPQMGLRTSYTVPDSSKMGKKSPIEVVPTMILEPVCRTGLCSQVWQGYLGVAVTGGYQFWTESDDGSVLTIDHQMIVNNSGNHGMEEQSGRAYLQNGWHVFQLNYENTGGPGDLQVHYAPIGGARKSIPASMLAH